MAFDDAACTKLGYYVYALFDPRESSAVPFYIGKGQNNRVFEHARGNVPDWNESDEEAILSPKLELIDRIQKANHKVDHRIIRHDLTENEALRVEASLIDLVNLMQPNTLLNAISGQGVAQGIISTDDLLLELNAKPLQTNDILLIVKIERQWGELLKKYGTAAKIPRGELYKAVRGDWRVSEARANEVAAVLAVARGIVRAVFVNEPWRLAPNPNETHRKRMQGTGTADASRFDLLLHTSVTHFFTTGSQNPIKYIRPAASPKQPDGTGER
ncbi:MAG TPA: hypothetical protein VIL19_08790 [Casimicrobiaceae bacterium]